MKLVFAIVSNDDASKVQTALVNSGFHVTRLSSTGGFLMAGNSTFLCATENDRVDSFIKIVKANSKQREQMAAMKFSSPIDVSVGGATIFVTDIERFEKV